MTIVSRITQRLALGLFVAGLAFSAPAQAQDGSIEEARKVLETWTKIQEPAVNAQTGEVIQNPTVVQKILLNDQHQQVASLGIQIMDNQEKKLVIEVPIGARLDSGLAIKIDEEKPVTLPYRVCFPSSCFAEMAIAEDFVNKLKAGNMLAVLVRPFPAGDIVGLPFSLQGFTSAFDGPTADIENLINARQRLQEEILASRDQAVQGLAERRRQELQRQREAEGAQPKQ